MKMHRKFQAHDKYPMNVTFLPFKQVHIALVHSHSITFSPFFYCFSLKIIKNVNISA